MTTTISDTGLQFAGGNLVAIQASYPTTGSYTAGDIIIASSTTGEVAGWKRLTTGSGNVLGTDWLAFGPIGTTAQTWQNVIGSRTSGTSYPNTTGRPIVVAVTTGGAGASSLVVGGVTVVTLAAATQQTMTAIVPPGVSYTATTTTAQSWAELR